MSRLFGTDGIRGISNKELTCELSMAVGRSLALILRNSGIESPRVIVGCDTRLSSDMLSFAMMSGLCSMGANAVYIGVTATPAVAFLTREEKADAGVMISASHNTWEYNGIKIFSGDGFKLPDILEERIESMVAKPEDYLGDTEVSVGKIYLSDEMREKYIEHLISTIPFRMDGMRIAVDCSNGSASSTAEKVFSRLGANVFILFSEPNGRNINEACGSTNIEKLRDYVKTNSLDAGFAFDGDADRCLCVDENGNIIDGDMILAMCALDLKQRGKLKNNTVVGTVMTNFGFNKFCGEYGITFLAANVGDRYVLEEIEKGDYTLGGEQSGHIIFREHATTGDGQLTAIKVLSLMKRSGKSLSELSGVMERYPQVIVNVVVSSEGKLLFYTDPKIKEAIFEAEKRLGDDGRILVRPSGTEQLIRIMTEGRDRKVIEEVAETVEKTIKERLKNK